MISFFVPGIPRPQGSKRAFIAHGRPILTESAGQPLKDWRAMIALTANAKMDEPLTGGVRLSLRFVFDRPKSHLRADGSLAKGHVNEHITRPDIDKLTRAVMDALTTAGVYRDDSQVVRLEAAKAYVQTGVPGVYVDVEEWHK